MNNQRRKQLVRVAENLRRDKASDIYYLFKKIRGRRFRLSLGTTDRAIADGRLREKLRDLGAADQGAADIKFEALVQKFLKIRAGKSASTVGTENGFANVLRKGFARGMAVEVRRIKTSDLLEWLTTETKAREWGWRCYNRARYFLRQLFEIALADGVVTEANNPFKMKLVRPKKKEPTFRKIPTLEQFGKILENVRAQRDNPHHKESADFLAFLGLLGVGQAEAAAAGRFNVVNGKINFTRKKTQRAFSVPVYEWAQELVEHLIANPYGSGGRFFKMQDGKKALTAACRRLGFHPFTQRNLRAMCIKRLYDRSVPVKQIALWQGHNDGGKLIQETYTEVFTDNDAIAERANLALVQSGKIVKFAA